MKRFHIKHNDCERRVNKLGFLNCSCLWCLFVFFVTFPCGILGQVWFLIVPIPDLCRLSYFEITNIILNLKVITKCSVFIFSTIIAYDVQITTMVTDHSYDIGVKGKVKYT